MELLSEVRTPAQVLNFALSRERGQENKREILRSSAPNRNNKVSAVSNDTGLTNTRQQQTAQPTNTNKELCWRCGGIFSPGHINQGTVKQAHRSICKKTGHFATICRSKLPQLPSRGNQHTNVPRDRAKANFESDKFKKV